MDKSVNKKYNEFWNNEELDIKSNNKDVNEKSKKTKKQTMPRKKAEQVIKQDVVVITKSFVDVQPTVVVPKMVYQPVVKTLKETYEQYTKDDKPYKIYLKGQVIFDSANHKDKPIFYDEYFILFGNKYIYKGIRFEKY